MLNPGVINYRLKIMIEFENLKNTNNNGIRNGFLSVKTIANLIFILSPANAAKVSLK